MVGHPSLTFLKIVIGRSVPGAQVVPDALRPYLGVDMIRSA
jgi:hypothetical protein